MKAGVAAERVFVALGANLGDARAALDHALRELAALPGTTRVATSGTYRSAPVNAQGPDYLNAVAELRTSLEPAGLLRELQRIEQVHGRLRPYPNAPRTLDLDLLIYGDRIINEPGLVVPHPRLHLRAFVLDPLSELAPDLALQRLGRLQDWRGGITDQALQRLP